MMRQWKHRWREWAVQIAVASAYAASFALLREVSFSHWLVFAGLRLFALLVLPYRFWPALVVGEFVPLALYAFACESQFGLLWAVLVSVPPIAIAMPAVRWCRERHGLFQDAATVRVGPLVLLVVIASVIWTLADLGTLSVTPLPPDYPRLDWGVLAARYFIGNFMGILTVTPSLLFARESWLTSKTGERVKLLVESRLCKQTISLLLPALAILMWLGSGGAGEGARQAARVAMFMPVVFLALRHGWHGAAVGGTAASIAVVLMMPAKYDLETLQAQVFICFAITTMMLLGARIANQNAREQKDRGELQLALELAQRNVYLGEVQLQQTSLALERARETVRSTFSLLLDRIRVMAPYVDERTMRRRVVVAQEQLYRLSDTLYPVVWQQHGLPVALREGAMARALSECGVTYWCDIQGQPKLRTLSATLHITLYRLICEVVGFVCSKAGTTGVRVIVRGGELNGRRWVVAQIDRSADAMRLERIRREDLIVRLPFNGLGVEAIRDRAKVFGGKVRVRTRRGGDRVSFVLFEPESPLC